MKLRIISLAVLMLLSAVCSAGCGEKKGSSSSGTDSEVVTTEEPTAPASGAEPVLSIGNFEGKPGETIDVEVSISGADGKWSSCGVHFSYDETLVCKTLEDGRFVDLEKGPATEKMSDIIAALWTENRTEEMVENKKYSLFFAAMATGDTGRDGVIATFKFTIPEDAAVGTVYPLEFFEYEGDMFLDMSSDVGLQNYAFSHWQNGSITVI